MRIVALLIFGKIIRILHFSDVVIQRATTAKKCVRADFGSRLFRQCRYHQTVMVCSGSNLLQFSQQRMIEIGQAQEGHIGAVVKQFFQQRRKEENKKKHKNQITIQGTTYVIDEDLWDSIEWRKVLKEITEKAYWNYKGNLVIRLSDYVAPNTKQRERIIAMLCHLLKEG